MLHANWFYVCTAFVCGGLVTGVYFSVISVQSTRRHRRGLRPAIPPRTSEDVARAIALEDIYFEYRHPGQAHYLTAEDKQDVQASVVRKLVGQLGDQSLLYQQAGYDFDDYLLIRP